MDPQPAEFPALKIFQMKVTLRDIEPAIWRRVLVPNDMTLFGLHYILQGIFDWEDDHEWEFINHEKRCPRGLPEQDDFGPFSIDEINGPAPDDDEDEYEETDDEFGADPTEDEEEATEERDEEDEIPLFEALPGRYTKLQYIYDWGDGWWHDIVVEKRLDPVPGEKYPVVIAGACAAPFDDCGGPWGYAEIAEAARAKQNPQEMCEWVPRRFNPDKFDLAACNRRLARYAGRPKILVPLSKKKKK